MAFKNDGQYLRAQAGTAFIGIEEAIVSALEEQFLVYALHAWRPLEIAPIDTLVIGSCEEGLKLLRQTGSGDWRTEVGQPHNPPSAWMPAPIPPK